MVISSRTAILFLLISAGAIPLGCTPGKREITPTTTGTDLKNMPRGRMTPLPFPGSSLARVTPQSTPNLLSSTADPATITARTVELDESR